MTDDEQANTGRMGLAMMALAWLLVGALLVAVFSGVLERQRNPNRALVATGNGEVTLQRNRAGHYLAPGLVNGHSVDFLLDTGATSVVVPGHLAARLGLVPGPAGTATTAAGNVRIYHSVANSVRIGGIELSRVPTIINPHMDGDTVLLGMSFMRELELVQRGDTLTLRHRSD